MFLDVKEIMDILVFALSVLVAPIFFFFDLKKKKEKALMAFLIVAMATVFGIVAMDKNHTAEVRYHRQHDEWYLERIELNAFNSNTLGETVLTGRESEDIERIKKDLLGARKSNMENNKLLAYVSDAQYLGTYDVWHKGMHYEKEVTVYKKDEVCHVIMHASINNKNSNGETIADRIDRLVSLGIVPECSEVEVYCCHPQLQKTKSDSNYIKIRLWTVNPVSAYECKNGFFVYESDW